MMRFALASVFAFFAMVQTSLAAPVEITWDDLVPQGNLGKEITFSNVPAIKGVPALNEFDGDQRDYELFLEDIKLMRDEQPSGGKLNTLLHGSKVRIAGYVTPVGFDDEDVTEFLFVPFLGACIHVPPPAANQIIYVKNAKGLKVDQIYEPVWLTGTLQATPVSTVLAQVGYSLEGGEVEIYHEEDY